MDPMVKPCDELWAPEGVTKLTFASQVDGLEDWALAWPRRRSRAWVVFLHGHGSTGDQIFTRQDLRDAWLPQLRELGMGLLSPHLRGNAWMSPAAVKDLRELIRWTRREFAIDRFLFTSGSMGATGNLIYAAQHPEDVDAIIARCPATDMADYHAWLVDHPGDVRDEIREAIEIAYGGTPDDAQATYEAHSVRANSRRLSMPLLLIHGEADALIPVEQSRALAAILDDAPCFQYVEIPGGDHDAPLQWPGVETWLKNNATKKGEPKS